MNGKRKVQSLLGLVLLTGCFCSSAADGNASEILARAGEIAARTSYTAELLSPSSRPQHAWVKKSPDGKSFSRVESTLADGRKIVLLHNSKGSFTMIAGKVVRDAPLPEVVKKDLSPAPEKHYTLAEGMHGKIACYIVTVEAKGAFAFKQEYYIGKKDSFIYQWNLYDGKGKKISSLGYADVKLNPPMDDSLFELPENADVTVSKSREEEKSAMISLMGT